LGIGCHGYYKRGLMKRFIDARNPIL
jgi:hypothetical protein